MLEVTYVLPASFYEKTLAVTYELPASFYENVSRYLRIACITL